MNIRESYSRALEQGTLHSAQHCCRFRSIHLAKVRPRSVGLQVCGGRLSNVRRSGPEVERIGFEDLTNPQIHQFFGFGFGFELSPWICGFCASDWISKSNPQNKIRLG